jgi:hypothetical protein
LRRLGVGIGEPELVPLQLLSFPFHEHVLQLTSWQVLMVAGQAYNSGLNAMAPRHMPQTLVGLGRQWAEIWATRVLRFG